jgi:hypothetical protein
MKVCGKVVRLALVLSIAVTEAARFEAVVWRP